MITVNRARCDECGDILESRDVHDFQVCSCGNLFVDGGTHYLRRGWRSENWTELSQSDSISNFAG